MANLPYSRLQLRRGDKSYWAAHDVILYDGEPGIEITKSTDANGNTIQKCKMKIGDGINPWSKLKYMVGSGSSGGAGTVSITVSGAPSTIEYGGSTSKTITISVNSECVKFKIGSDIVSNITPDSTETNYSASYILNINNLQSSKNYVIEAYNDEGNIIATKTITINPSYKIFYWLSEGFSDNENIPTNPEIYNNVTGLTSSGITIYVPSHKDDNLYLYIATPQSFNVPTFTSGGFATSPNNVYKTTCMYGENNVNYNVYQIGSIGLGVGTDIIIKK